MSILKKIVENTRENLKAKKAKLSLEDVKSSLKELDLPKSNCLLYTSDAADE